MQLAQVGVDTHVGVDNIGEDSGDSMHSAHTEGWAFFLISQLHTFQATYLPSQLPRSGMPSALHITRRSDPSVSGHTPSDQGHFLPGRLKVDLGKQANCRLILPKSLEVLVGS